MILPQYITSILNQIEYAGFEAFAVGGCVRDSLLNKTPDDWDITTSALPENILEIFKNLPTIPTGIKHGTVTVMADDNPVEITTYRIDGNYKDFRHPETVTFSRNLTDDLSRRDFTINAMAYNPKSGLIDPFRGKQDIETKTLKCVGNPETRFSEDALRIMRALRFSSSLDFKIDAPTRNAIKKHKHLLSRVANERIQAEFSKLLISEKPQSVLSDFACVFAEILKFNLTAKAKQWQKNVSLINPQPLSLPLRLALLLEGIYPAEKIGENLKALKFDNKTINSVKALSKCLNTNIIADRIFLKKLLSTTPYDTLVCAIKARTLKDPDNAHTFHEALRLIEEILQKNQCFTIKGLAIDGNILKKELNTEGRVIGFILNKLLTAVIEEDCLNTTCDLLEYAKKHLI